MQDGGGAANPETVETYRQRIARIVALYTNGLGTVDAMRRMTEAQLPVDVDATPRAAGPPVQHRGVRARSRPRRSR